MRPDGTTVLTYIGERVSKEHTALEPLTTQNKVGAPPRADQVSRSATMSKGRLGHYVH